MPAWFLASHDGRTHGHLIPARNRTNAGMGLVLVRGTQPYLVMRQKDRRDPETVDAVSGSVEVRRWGRMPKRASWLKVAVMIVLDWRFLVALAALLRVLLR